MVDANVLLYARNDADPRNPRATAFVEEALNGLRRLGLPRQTLTAFVRIATHPRVFAAPLMADEAADQVTEWLAAQAAWLPVPTDGHATVVLAPVRMLRLAGALVSAAHLAALAIEHGHLVHGLRSRASSRPVVAGIARRARSR